MSATKRCTRRQYGTPAGPHATTFARGRAGHEMPQAKSAPLGRPLQGSSERSELGGPGRSRGAGEGWTAADGRGMEPGHLRCRRRARRPSAGTDECRCRHTGGSHGGAEATHGVLDARRHPNLRADDDWEARMAAGAVPGHDQSLRHRRDDGDPPARRDAGGLRRLPVATARRAVRGLALSARLAEVRLRRRAVPRFPAKSAQALRRLPVGASGRCGRRRGGVAKRRWNAGIAAAGAMRCREAGKTRACGAWE